ncbi:MAG: serpin family protein [Prolixibacteraceae bacterium]|nr:serpin family protein [Prolixibacteraceae bacterium]
MMYTKFSLLFLLGTVFTVGCTKDTVPSPEVKQIVMSDKSLKLVKASNTFSFSLLNKALDGTIENRMVSPLSVSTALSMTLNGASGTTLTAMQKTLGLDGLTRDEINTINSDLMTALQKADPSVAMDIANSIWIRKDFSVLDPFIAVNQTYYKAQVSKLDFNTAALSTINKWVSDNTNGKIPTILSSISSNEIMFLINAIYFNGKWKYQFEPSKTASEKFACSDQKTIFVPMMKMESSFGYSVQPGYKALKMPYGVDKFQMVLLLPEEGVSPDKIAANLNSEKWATLNAALLAKTKLPVWIPKWKFSWDITLNGILSSLGMDVAFDPNKANFSGINADNQLYITKVIHKTYIDVTESGTEAAAVTSVGIGLTSMPVDPPSFYAIRPFLFFITEEDTGAILFAGKVENPLVNN